ncbi:MAG TPA: helix-turn-helix domain-containing protein [Pyrinomonadaceae bacterium]|jgi:excisionase family DNA binding protein
MNLDTVAKIEALFDQAKSAALALLNQEEVARKPEPQADDDEGITAAEAAEMLGVKAWRVYEMVKQRILPAYRPSARTLRIRRGAVRELIRTGKCTAEKKGTGNLLPLLRSGVIQSAASNPKKGGLRP